MEAFIAKRDEYPVDRSEAVKILNKYDKKKPNVQVPSEGTAFTQKSKNNNNNNKGEGKSYDKKKADDGNKGNKSKKDWFADKTYYLHGKTGHSVKKCPKRSTIEDGDLSVKSSSSKGSAKKSIAEFKKKMKKKIAQLETQIKEDEDLSDDEEHSHVQFTAVSKLIE
jgi:hypothetical protein